MIDLEPLETLFDATSAEPLPLPPRLLELYGSLRFPAHGDRPHVVGNFVASMDGVVSLGLPGNASGKAISGGNPHDRMVMGLLRSTADAVITGAGTYRSSAGHRWTPESAFSPLAADFQEFRRLLGKPRCALNVIVTASGDLDPGCLPAEEASFLIVTTGEGARILRTRFPSSLVPIIDAGEGSLTSGQIIEAVTRMHPSGLLLVEAGPRLMSAFIAGRSLDELFLTIAPQIAGRDRSAERPGFVSGERFAPEDARWARLDSVKRSGSLLFLRYALQDAA
jgi:riboflavin biosynthesis pyrimidine reductase